MITTDMHVHSIFSSDSTESPESIIETAIRHNYQYVYFTDHHDIDFPVSAEEPLMDFQLDFAKYFDQLTQLKERYQDQIQLMIGVEMGICPETTDKVTKLVSSYPFDFVIGSSHLSALENGDPYWPSYYDGKTPLQAYQEYFYSEVENVKNTKAFDVYGHLDYAIRYCPDSNYVYQFKDYADIFEELFRLLIENGKGIEINTAGISKMGMAHPHIEALKMYREMGGEIVTIGSDAHSAQNIGFGFDIAEQMLQECNFSYYTIFQKRKPEFIRL
ncbi:MAG: histidinol-phosphatase HisJ family protein [Eubacteriales bacterium]|nr:histidinol-phosphatase HisJ family protein [Eubacteriales bacterium]